MSKSEVELKGSSDLYTEFEEMLSLGLLRLDCDGVITALSLKLGNDDLGEERRIL